MTGAFLAEWADVADNKLQVSGGVLSSFTTGADRSVNLIVVILTHADEGVQPAGGRHAKSVDGQQLSIVQLEITQPSGEIATVGFELPGDLNDSEVGCAFFPLELELPFDGRHELVLTCNQVRIPLPLTVISAAPAVAERSGISDWTQRQ
jgi:hypothetical protein